MTLLLTNHPEHQIIMTCDRCDGGLDSFKIDDIVKTLSRIKATGWKETFTARGAKQWLCPGCSGKEV